MCSQWVSWLGLLSFLLMSAYRRRDFGTRYLWFGWLEEEERSVRASLGVEEREERWRRARDDWSIAIAKAKAV